MHASVVLGILSGVFSAISYPPYIRAILKGEAKPERASWLIWTVLTTMGFFTQLAVGATNSLWLPGVQAIGVIVVFLLALRYGFGGLMKRDVITLVAAGATLLIWFFTKNATIAVCLTIFIDALGAWLTVIKAYEHPESETMTTWALSGAGGLCALLAVQTMSFALISYPAYIFLINFAVVIAIIFGRKAKHTEGSQEKAARAESTEGKDLLDADIPSVISQYEVKNLPPTEILGKQWMLCVVGLVGVGKTSLLKKLCADLNLVRVCNDDIRMVLRDRGFNFLRTIDVARTLVHKYAKEGRAMALDGDSIAPEHRADIEHTTKERGVPLVYVHITAPEQIVIARRMAATYGKDTFFESAEHAIADYYRRKPLHEKYLPEINFDFTFDTSRPDLAEQIEKFEKFMKEQGF